MIYLCFHHSPLIIAMKYSLISDSLDIPMDNSQLVISLIQQMSLFLVIAYLLSRIHIFIPIVQLSKRKTHRLWMYLLFSTFCILGTYFGQSVEGVIANTRAIGAVLGGLFGGPVIGFLVGLTGGLHRYSLGGFTSLACAIATTLEGVFAGIMHIYFRRTHLTQEGIYSPIAVFIITLMAEMLQMLTLILIAKPQDQAIALVQTIAIPMMIANPIGAALCMMMINDRQSLHHQFGRNYSAKALRLAQRIVGVLTDLNPQSAQQVATIVHEETGVSAVAITNREHVLAFTGLGADHHQPLTPIASDLTYQSIEHNQVVFADGVITPYHCQTDSHCPLGSVLVIPLRCANHVIGTVKLYESKRKFFLTINRTLGEGIARIIEEQLMRERLSKQEYLLTQAELKLVRAQIHPHFLFNALNTIAAIMRHDASQARRLICDLATFLRNSLKQAQEIVTIEDELHIVKAYLNIEQARYGDRLTIQWDIPENILHWKLPSFTIQPLVENALKHGISQQLKPGLLHLYFDQDQLVVEDNSGAYAKETSHCVGLNIVTTRLKDFLGENAQLTIRCVANEYTRVYIPLRKEKNKEIHDQCHSSG